MPEALLDWLRAESGAGQAEAAVPGQPVVTAEYSPAEGAPGDVAKVLISAARSGLTCGSPGHR